MAADGTSQRVVRRSSLPPTSGLAPRAERESHAMSEEELDASESERVEAGELAETAGGDAAPDLAPSRPATPPPPTAAAPVMATSSEHTLHDDPLADAFFRHPDKPVIDVWEDQAPVVHTMSRGSRRAMIASIGIFVVSALCITSYSVYQNWIMPSPAELGASNGDLAASLPTPIDAPPSAAAELPREPQLLAVPPSNLRLSAAAAAPVTQPATEPAPVEPQPEPQPQPQAAPTPAPTETLAAIAARQPTADGPATVEGAVGQHLRGSLDETAKDAERGRDPANVPLTAAITGSLGGSSDPAPPQEAPARAFGTTAGAPSYEELVEVGRALSKRNRRVEASEAFRRALLKSPQGSAALSGLSYVYLNAEENQTARAYAQRAVQSDATNAEGWIVLGAALEMLGDRAGAQDAYRNCVQHGQGPYLLECRRVLR